MFALTSTKFFATASIESQETASINDEVRSMQRSITNLLALRNTEPHCIYALCAHALSAISTKEQKKKEEERVKAERWTHPARITHDKYFIGLPIQQASHSPLNKWKAVRKLTRSLLEKTSKIAASDLSVENLYFLAKKVLTSILQRVKPRILNSRKKLKEIHFSSLDVSVTRDDEGKSRNQMIREQNDPADRTLRVQEGEASNEVRAGDQRLPSVRLTKEEGDRTRDMVYTCNYTSPWWETTTTIGIDGGDTLDLRFSRSRSNLTACTLLVTSSLLENDMGEQHGEERGDASSRRGNGRVLRSAKSRALKAKDVYHRLAISTIADHFQPARNNRSSIHRHEHNERHEVINPAARRAARTNLTVVFFARWDKIFGGKLHSGEIRWESKERALSTHSLLLSTRRGGRAELARAEPSDTELRIQRGEPLCESSLRRPGIWILLLIGIFRVTVRRDPLANSHSRLGPFASRLRVVYEVGKTSSYDIETREDRNFAEISDCVYISRRDTRDLTSLRDSLVGVERSIN
ncbi:hypothetical protein G5I_05821 [Acromyrmex echinatior]|uniref:Uncharacterized protein n=1 Tax=Acromyrmex echinatior TaxID=103372 RepID=F4WJE2_ACREC|nr:hypothetical protein G5I_05821 [Acromyrmex echinatior]